MVSVGEIRTAATCGVVRNTRLVVVAVTPLRFVLLLDPTSEAMIGLPGNGAPSHPNPLDDPPLKKTWSVIHQPTAPPSRFGVTLTM